MSQSRAGSLVETLSGTAIGFTINYLANLLVLPAFGFHSLTPGKNFAIGCIYTAISLLRGYGVRRLFNAMGLFPQKT